MRINTAFILCAGFGKRLNPLTLEIPKPLIKLNNVVVLETCINLIENLGIQQIILNTFYLKDQIHDFINHKKFNSKIKIIDDGDKILDTGGGISNMMKHTNEENVLIFNPDTIWEKNYSNEIIEMENIYFSKKLKNILLLVKKELSFDQNLTGDFELKKNLLKKGDEKNFIFIGCQILNKNLFKNYKIENFSISQIWNELLKKNNLNGFESRNKFYHITNLETFKKLEDL